ncbi:hypothetical protein BZA77DRAFT_61112 [Pyronema omphalodes]|nr:hypothetical protein BZA77DRAFT_61112 [Pyronema omphalodes]
MASLTPLRFFIRPTIFAAPARCTRSYANKAKALRKPKTFVPPAKGTKPTVKPSFIVKPAVPAPGKIAPVAPAAPVAQVAKTAPITIQDVLAQTGFKTVQEKLALVGKPQLLFAGHPKRFIWAVYGVAGCFAAFGANFYRENILNAPKDLPDWVKKMVYVGCAFVAIVAGVAAWFPTRIVEKIYYIPAKSGFDVLLYRRPALPMLPWKKIQVPAKSVTLETEFHPVVEVIKAEPHLSLMEKALKYFQEGVATSNFKSIYVNGKKLHLHKQGWVWERRGLDILFKKHGNLKY